MNLPGLEIRIQQLLDDELSAEEFAELESELQENPEAMDLYLSYTRLQCKLNRRGSFQTAVNRHQPLSMEWVLAQQRRRALRTSLFAAAAAVIILAVGMWVANAPNPPTTLATVRAAQGSDFSITHHTDGERPSGNALVENSRAVLRHGVVELDLPHDVRAVISAPAELTFRDDRTLELDHGLAYFEVSSVDGRGFTVATPHQRIVDLGTAFGIDCPPGASEVELHVLEGKVRVDGTAGTKGEVIEASRSVLLAGSRIQRELDGPPAALLRHLPPRIDTLLDEDFESGLIAGHNYVIRMDPPVIRDLAGNNFGGIDDDTTWNFTPLGKTLTVLPFTATWNYFHPLDGTDPAVADTDFNTTWYTQNDPGNRYDGPAFDASSKSTTVAAGAGSGLFGYGGINFGAVTVDIGAPPRGSRHTAYFVATFDLGANPANTVEELTANILADDGAFVYINGRLAGGLNTGGTPIDTYLARTPEREAPKANESRTTTITLDESLLIDGVNSIAVSLHNASPASSDLGFTMEVVAELTPRAGNEISDWMSGFSVGDEAGTDDDPAPRPPVLGGSDDSPPVLVATYPADDSMNAAEGGQLKMLFDEPIQFGTGRIIIQNVTNWSEDVLVAGARVLSIDDLPSKGASPLRQDGSEVQASGNGRVLTINPPIGLEDGVESPGLLAGWESSAPVTFFNPRGDGEWYENEDLQDDSSARGRIGSMRSPGMVSISAPIRREVGVITEGSRYTVGTTIGVRAKTARTPAIFAGYSIRITSGDTVLAERASMTPPGPANSVSAVGLSWDAATLPDGIHPGDPLSIEISPGRVDGLASGSLDLNTLRISVLAENSR